MNALKKKQARRKDLLESLRIIIRFSPDRVYHSPEGIAKHLKAKLGDVKIAIHQLVQEGVILEPFRRLPRGGWVRTLFERRERNP